MEFFKKKTNIDFMGIRKFSWTFSAILIIVSLTSIFVRGINWGLDFTGGYAIQASFPTAPDVGAVKEALDQVHLAHANVITFGSRKDLMITFSVKDLRNDLSAFAPNNNQALQTEIGAELKQALPEAQIVAINYTGPQVGAELAQTGILAMLIAIIVIMVYIALRFELKFAF